MLMFVKYILNKLFLNRGRKNIVNLIYVNRLDLVLYYLCYFLE